MTRDEATDRILALLEEAATLAQAHDMALLTGLVSAVDAEADSACMVTRFVGNEHVLAGMAEAMPEALEEGEDIAPDLH